MSFVSLCRFVLAGFLLSAPALADVLQVRDFTSDVYSRALPNATKKISLDLELIGRDMSENEAYALDALNIIIGSFYVEDLLTSKGKERLKEEYVKYASKKHSIDIDNVLILRLNVLENLSLDRIIDAIRQRNLCAPAPSLKEENANKIIISPKESNQLPIDLNSIKEFGKDFGQ